MKILITGTDGAIGKELSNLFSETQFDVLKHTKKKKNIKSKNFFFCQDLSKKFQLNEKINIIIHCAGSNKKTFKNNKKNIFNKNLKIIKNLIEFSNRNCVNKFFFLSSVDVYGEIKKKIIFENCTGKKISLYGKLKLASEKALFNKSNKFSLIALRLPGVLTILDSKQKPYLINLIQKMKKNKKIEIYNPKSLFNNTLDVKEIFEVIKYMINKNIKSSIYNLSASKPIFFDKIVELLKKKIGYKKNILIVKNKKNSFTIDNKKIIKETGVKINSTDKIVKRFLKNYLSK